MKECSLATLFSSDNVCMQKLPMLFEKRWKPPERLRRGARVQPCFSSVGFSTKVGEITCGAFFSQPTQVSQNGEVVAGSTEQGCKFVPVIHFPHQSTTDGTFCARSQEVLVQLQGPWRLSNLQPRLELPSTMFLYQKYSQRNSPFPFSEGWKVKKWYNSMVQKSHSIPNHLDVFLKPL